MSNSCDSTAVKSVSLECLCDAVDYATEVLRGPDLDSTSNSNHALSKNYSNFQKIFGKFESFFYQDLSIRSSMFEKSRKTVITRHWKISFFNFFDLNIN